jgi:hypothetical protein
MDMETPEGDAAEQARELADEDEENGAELRELPIEANEADAAEQNQDAGYDDEDYR